MMTELEVMDLLSDYLEDRLDRPTRQAVEEGLARYSAAAEALEDLRGLVKLMGALPRVAAPQGLAQQTTQAATKRVALNSQVRAALVRQALHEQLGVRWRQSRRLLAMAAALVIGACGSLVVWNLQTRWDHGLECPPCQWDRASSRQRNLPHLRGPMADDLDPAESLKGGKVTASANRADSASVYFTSDWEVAKGGSANSLPPLLAPHTPGVFEPSDSTPEVFTPQVKDPGMPSGVGPLAPSASQAAFGQGPFREAPSRSAARSQDWPALNAAAHTANNAALALELQRRAPTDAAQQADAGLANPEPDLNRASVSLPLFAVGSRRSAAALADNKSPPSVLLSAVAHLARGNAPHTESWASTAMAAPNPNDAPTLVGTICLTGKPATMYAALTASHEAGTIPKSPSGGGNPWPSRLVASDPPDQLPDGEAACLELTAPTASELGDWLRRLPFVSGVSAVAFSIDAPGIAQRLSQAPAPPLAATPGGTAVAARGMPTVDKPSAGDVADGHPLGELLAALPTLGEQSLTVRVVLLPDP